MARRKVKLAWIANDSTRKATFKKRKKGFLKKIKELSILCNVEACAIINSPYEPQQEVWPTYADAHQIVMNFKSLSELEKSKKMMNHEGFLRQRIGKLIEQIKKQKRENREAEMTILMSNCLLGKALNDVFIQDLNDLSCLLESKIKLVQNRIESIKKSNLLPPPATTTTGRESRVDDPTAVEIEHLQRQQWFMEVMNTYDHMGYGGEEMAMPYIDSNSPWMDTFPRF